MQKGFTLVETLVAITVLLLVVIGPMTVAQRGIQNAYYATEQATAVFLAQEAIEAVRQFRDESALKTFEDGEEDSGEWFGELTGCTSLTGQCAYRKHDGFVSCSAATNCELYVADNGEYVHNSQSGNKSPFTRTVQIVSQNVDGSSEDDAVEVIVTVSWENRIFSTDSNREVVLRTWVYDHYRRYENN